ncbi:baseplate J/gp47 family protein [Streptomyces bugieae]|uniref:Baseplate J/gp47 family protein n=1 Tax=Streptomyces bugieae TaxID=3098223 RepID=A0ABU7NN10_9ACTN|nr:baseplate J/gp47 family protein [Streptomyces sp. DSM 41528]
MNDLDQFGVTAEGFVVKGIDRIVADQQARARAMFGSDVDLTSGSALRKVLDAAAVHVHELWRGLEAQYYANFVTTAQGPGLDLLGTDLGLPRRPLQAAGEISLALTGGEPERRVILPEGTVIETVDPPRKRLRTTSAVRLVTGAPPTTVGVRAVERGPDGNLAADRSLRLEPVWAQLHLNLGAATVKPTNPEPVVGGELLEPDDVYRSRLLGVPRTLWTQEAVLAQILDVPGVRDAAIFDPLGGVDASHSRFHTYLFGQRTFAPQRQIGSPYYFEVVVAVEPGWPWTPTDGDIPAVHDAVLEVVRQWRPVSIFPEINPANQVDVGIRATLLIQAGHDPDAIRGEILAAVQTGVDRLRLGRAVLHSDLVLTARSTAGVVDVQNLRLRRCAPAFGDVSHAGAVFGNAQELSVGENLLLAPDEIARFALDSPLIDIQVSSQ